MHKLFKLVNRPRFPFGLAYNEMPVLSLDRRKTERSRPTSGRRKGGVFGIEPDINVKKWQGIPTTSCPGKVKQLLRL